MRYCVRHAQFRWWWWKWCHRSVQYSEWAASERQPNHRWYRLYIRTSGHFIYCLWLLFPAIRYGYNGAWRQCQCRLRIWTASIFRWRRCRSIRKFYQCQRTGGFGFADFTRSGLHVCAVSDCTRMPCVY